MKRHFLRKLFLTYTVLIITAVCVCYMIFLYQEKEAQRNKVQQNIQTRAELMARILDDKFDTFDQLAWQIYNNSWRPYVISRSELLYSRVDYQKKLEICSEMRTIAALLQITGSVGFLIPEKDLAVDGVGFRSCESYFRSVGVGENWTKAWEAFREEPADIPKTFAVNPQAGAEGSFVVLKRVGESRSELLFLLVEGKNFKRFLDRNLPDAVWFSISEDGETFFTKGEKNPGGQEISILSSKNLWEYHFQIQLQEAGYNGLQIGYIAASFLGFAVIGLFFAWLLARLTYRPLALFLKKYAGEQGEEIYNLEELGSVYDGLMESRNEMENMANQYFTMGQNHFLTSLLLGTYDKRQAAEYVLIYRTGFPKEGIYRVVIFSRLSGKEQAPALNMLMELQLACGGKGIAAVMCSVGEGYAMILGAGKGKKTVLAAQAEEFHRILDERFPELEIELYTGGMHNALHGIHLSYQEARDKMLLDKNESEQLVYYYPFEVEEHMNSQMRNGNFEGVQSILRELERVNARRKVLPEIEEQVIDLIYKRCYRFSSGMGFAFPANNERYMELKETQDIQQLWQLLRDLVQQIGELYRAEQQLQSLGRRIVNYVDQNYTDSGLTQQGIADYFGISRPAVSKLFKETLGMNFVDYVHKKRVEYAVNLIENGNYDVIKVAKAVGYENEVTLRRAFIRNQGITPRDYIKRVKKAKTESDISEKREEEEK